MRKYQWLWYAIPWRPGLLAALLIAANTLVRKALLFLTFDWNSLSILKTWHLQVLRTEGGPPLGCCNNVKVIEWQLGQSFCTVARCSSLSSLNACHILCSNLDVVYVAWSVCGVEYVRFVFSSYGAVTVHNLRSKQQLFLSCHGLSVGSILHACR